MGRQALRPDPRAHAPRSVTGTERPGRDSTGAGSADAHGGRRATGVRAREPQPPLQLRPVRHRRRQPARARRRARSRRAPGPGLQPAVPVRARPGSARPTCCTRSATTSAAFGGGAVVRYTTVEAFTNDFIEALGARSLDDFKHTYRDADVLLIDDVQFLASKAKTEEEFFHTFNALYETGRQLVLTCDRLPRALVGSRGAAARALRGRPGRRHPTRRTSPRASRSSASARCSTACRSPTPPCSRLIAERVTDNIRALEGALIRVVAYHSLTGHRGAIDIELTMTVLDTMYPQRAPAPPADLDRADPGGRRFALRPRRCRAARRRAARHASPGPGNSRSTWPGSARARRCRRSGEAFGGRNHATVLHACKRVSDRLADDQQLCEELSELKAALG